MKTIRITGKKPLIEMKKECKVLIKELIIDKELRKILFNLLKTDSHVEELLILLYNTKIQVLSNVRSIRLILSKFS